MKLFVEIIKLIVLVAASLFFILAVLFLNSQGTTWGAGPALQGLMLIIPCFVHPPVVGYQIFGLLFTFGVFFKFWKSSKTMPRPKT